MIPRLYTTRLAEELRNARKILLLYGARQVGKTTLVRLLLRDYPGKILEINADEQPFLEALSSRDAQKLRGLVAGYDVLFLDEAQRIPDIGINLKILHDSLPVLKIIASGSSSLDLANRVREPLTGRTWTYTLYPISVGEWRQHSGANEFETARQVETMLLYGMYPEVFSFENPARKIQYLHELTTAYLYKDILAIANVKYPEKLAQLLRLLAYQVGHQVSIQELTSTLQVHRDAVLNYLDLLEKAFVIFRLGGYNRNLRKEVTKMGKIFFYDTGVRNALIGNFSPLAERRDTGQLWENFLIAERLKSNAYAGRYGQSYFWRTHTGAELDLVEEFDGQLWGYEFKWGAKTSKPPQAWLSTYPESRYACINRENFVAWLDAKTL